MANFTIRNSVSFRDKRPMFSSSGSRAHYCPPHAHPSKHLSVARKRSGTSNNVRVLSFDERVVVADDDELREPARLQDTLSEPRVRDEMSHQFFATRF